MPTVLDSADRKLLLAAGAVMLLLMAAIAFETPSGETGSEGQAIPSSYSASPGGANAAYLLLGELHYNVQRWERSPIELPDDPQRYVPDSMRAIGVDPLSIDHGHALAVFDLPPHHSDPFDRLLVAQARALRLPIVTADRHIALYDVETLLI